MGRKKLNRTPEEIKEQNKKRARKFYEKNKERINRKSLERYYKKKGIGESSV